MALVLLVSLFAFAACANDLGPKGGWSGVAAEGDYLYVGNKDGRVVRISQDTFTLDQAWRFPSGDDVGEIYTVPVIDGGTAYGGGYKCVGNTCTGKIFAFDLETGVTAWVGGEYEIKTKLIGGFGIGDTVLAVGTSAINEEGARGNLVGIDMTPDAPRREMWRLPVDGAVWGGVSVQDNIAYFGTMGGTFYAVDLADSAEYEANVEARIIWSFDTGGAIAGKPLLADGKVYFGSFNESVYALDIAFRTQNPGSTTLDSTSEWSFGTGDWVWATPLLNDGTLYVSNIRGLVYALNADGGGEVWGAPAQVGEEVVSQAALFEGVNGPALAIASGEGDISVVRISSGQVTGEFSTNGKGVKSSPLVVGDSLIAHSDNGQLWRFRTDTLALSGCIEAKGDGKRCD